MHSTAALSLLAFVAVAIASQLQSDNPAFPPGGTGCISASNAVGAPALIENCIVNGDISPQDWTFTQNGVPQQLSIFGDKCLDVIGGVNADGTKLQIWTCTPGNTNQLWIPLGDSTFQWAGTNKCVDLTDGNINPGTQLQVWTCDPNNSNQHWSTPALCLAASSNADGARLSLDVCGGPATIFPGGNDTWVIPASGTNGPISTYDGTKCLDVTNGNSTNGNLVQIWSCIPGSTNQMWRFEGSATTQSILWVGQNKCLDVKDGVYVSAGTSALQIWDCDNNNLDPNQWWFPQ
ncbi:ricin B lectin [Marasmius fiardii PR-910]|nr:ricin B lectin [Marasmius fiardii PR-910]